MSNDGRHDDLVWEALQKLSDDDRQRCLREMEQWAIGYAETARARRRGVSVAPYWRRPLADILAAEAERRADQGDLTCLVWAAQADWADLTERVTAIGRALRSRERKDNR